MCVPRSYSGSEFDKKFIPISTNIMISEFIQKIENELDKPEAERNQAKIQYWEREIAGLRIEAEFDKPERERNLAKIAYWEKEKRAGKFLILYID